MVRKSMTSARQSAKVRKVRIDANTAGQRIDNFLLRELKGVPRSAVYKLLRRGEVRINGGRARPTRKLAEGDEVRIPPVRMAAPGEAPKVSVGLSERLQDAVLFEDKDLLVIDKPTGLAVHGGSGQSLGLIEALRHLHERGRDLELAHRLDQATSGCLIVTKRRAALRSMHALLREGGIRKTYLALVAGRWPTRTRRVEAPLKKSVSSSGERFVRVRDDGKTARTDFRVLTASNKATLVEVRLHTGRTHQIRVHAAHMGHPLAGDEKYGDEVFNQVCREHGLTRLFLHAYELAWAERTCRAPLPVELQSVLNSLKLALREPI